MLFGNIFPGAHRAEHKPAFQLAPEPMKVAVAKVLSFGFRRHDTAEVVQGPGGSLPPLKLVRHRLDSALGLW